MILCLRSDSREKNDRLHLSHCKNEERQKMHGKSQYLDLININGAKKVELLLRTLFDFSFSWMFRMCLATLLAVRNFTEQIWHEYGWMPV